MKGKTRRLIKLAQRGNKEAALELKRRAAARKDRRALSFVSTQPNNR